MSHRPLEASVIVIGDEILGGFVQDTNSCWLARRLQHHGVELSRIVTVPDDLGAIDEALQTELGRTRPRLVFTSGGIGSTPDDLTLEAVAHSLGRGLVVEPTIAARITAAVEWSRAHGLPVSAEHARSMRKMARVPEGAYLLSDAEGFAPGVAVDVDGGSGADGGATVVILPGIPSELRRITTEGIEPRLLAGRGEPQHVAELSHGYPESTLNPVLDQLVGAFPDVHVGSYPGRECLVRLQGPQDRVEAAMSLVRAYVADLDADPAAADVRARWGARWSD